METKIESLSDKEREVLRLFARGFDVKSSAVELDVSHYTVTERLRSARNKLGVTSSREAARLLSEMENRNNRFSVNRLSGVASEAFPAAKTSPPDKGIRGRQEAAGNMMKQGQAAFMLSPEHRPLMQSLPLRKPGEVSNPLTRQQRLMAILEVSTKLAGLFALVCLIAFLFEQIV